ncbi:MAG: CAP domain-containing protein, partial [Eubacterium sp.]
FNAFLENSKGLTTEQKQGLTEDQVMDLYDKYLAKYHVKGSDKLFDFIDETYNSDGSLSQESMDQALAIINFMRELVGIKTVTWDDDYNKASQAGVDFLKDNKLDIDHEAANGSGNALAAKGLMCSNLAQGSRSFYDLWDLLLMFYGDDDASNRVALGHRAWMFNSSNTKMGLGYTTGNGLNYLAIYVMDMSNGYESDQYSDVNGSMPEEILEEIRTSISCPWQVGVGYDTDQDSDITVTITDS